MYTTFHFGSAEEINIDILEVIKATFKSKPIIITVQENYDANTFLLSNQKNKELLLQSIAQQKEGELANNSGKFVD